MLESNSNSDEVSRDIATTGGNISFIRDESFGCKDPRQLDADITTQQLLERHTISSVSVYTLVIRIGLSLDSLVATEASSFPETGLTSRMIKQLAFTALPNAGGFSILVAQVWFDHNWGNHSQIDQLCRGYKECIGARNPRVLNAALLSTSLARNSHPHNMKEPKAIVSETLSCRSHRLDLVRCPAHEISSTAVSIRSMIPVAMALLINCSLDVVNIPEKGEQERRLNSLISDVQFILETDYSDYMPNVIHGSIEEKDFSENCSDSLAASKHLADSLPRSFKLQRPTSQDANNKGSDRSIKKAESIDEYPRGEGK